jgi:hypothetical protein
MVTVLATAAHPEVESADEQLGKLLDQNVRIVMVRLCGVPGNRRIEGTKTTLEEKELDEELFSRPTLRLLSADWRKKFGAVRYAADKILAGAAAGLGGGEGSIPDCSGLTMIGCSVVAACRFDEVAKAIEDLDKNQLRPIVADLITAYPALLKEMKEKIGSQEAWLKVQDKLPKPSDLDKDIQLKFYRLPVTFISDSGKAAANEMASAIVAGLAKGVSEAVERINERLSGQSNVRSSTFTELSQELQKLLDFSFSLSPETVQKANEARAMLEGLTPDVINQDKQTASRHLTESVQKAITAVASELKQDAGGRFRRAIHI